MPLENKCLLRSRLFSFAPAYTRKPALSRFLLAFASSFSLNAAGKQMSASQPLVFLCGYLHL